MNTAYHKINGWKYYYLVPAEKSRNHIIPSIIATVFIVLIVAQILSVIDKRLEFQASEKISLNSLFSIPVAQAAELDYSKEATKMIQSSNDLTLGPKEYTTFQVGFKNNTKKIWKEIGPEQILIVQKKDGTDYRTNSAIYGSLREEAKPGQIAYFVIHFIAPDASGPADLNMVLIKSGKKISGSDFDLNYQVKEKPMAVFVNAPAPTNNCPDYRSASALDSTDCLPVTPTTDVTPAALPDGPNIRVGIFNNPDVQIIRPSSAAKVLDSNGNVLLNVPASTTVAVDYLEGQNQYGYGLGSISNNTTSFLKIVSDDPSNVFEIVSYENRPAWKPSINDNTFLGALELHYNAPNNRTWMINELPLETYIKGTAEVGNDSPIEYLKAMAIAERTYATFHLLQNTKHASEFFTVDATYDQVYKGYGTQQRMSHLGEAVDATKGQVVTYNGDIALTPYFSWSDGHTRSMLEVWKVDKPWLHSVQEPAGYDKTTMFGHGVGLSARGAYILAHDQNYNFDQILKYYYTGISVAANYDGKF